MSKNFVELVIGNELVLRFHKTAEEDVYSMMLTQSDIERIQKEIDDSFPRMMIDEQEA